MLRIRNKKEFVHQSLRIIELERRVRELETKLKDKDKETDAKKKHIRVTDIRLGWFYRVYHNELGLGVVGCCYRLI